MAASAAAWPSSRGESGDHLQAVQALAVACAPGNDSAACERLPALQALGTRCGRSRQRHCLWQLPRRGWPDDTLDFGDAGRVGIGWDSQLRARVEDGDIRIRHDKGGDFVLRPLPGQLLAWTRGPASRYSCRPRARAPAARRNTTRCCRCHGTARRHWPAAVPKRAARRASCRAATSSVTALPVRPVATGRRALRHRVPCRCPRGLREPGRGAGHSGDVDARATLERLCTADRSGRHVACDVLDTGNWSALELGRVLQEAVDGAAAGDTRRRVLPTASAEPASACPQRRPALR